MASDAVRLPANAVEFVPHRGTMLLIGELRESSPETAMGVSVIASGNPFLDSRGVLDGICLVEYLAQLTAASEGFNAKASGDGVIRSGYLAGITDFSIKGRARAGDTLQLKMRKVMEFNNIVVAEGDVHVGGECLASGKLKFYIAEGVSPAAAAAPVEAPAAGSAAHPGRGLIYGHVLENMKAANISSGNGTASVQFRLQKGFPGFNGHFPGNPILPGIVMLAMSKAACESVCGFPLMLSKLASAKFTKLVLPGDVVNATVNVSESGGVYAVKAQLTSEGKNAAAFEYSAMKEPAENE